MDSYLVWTLWHQPFQQQIASRRTIKWWNAPHQSPDWIFVWRKYCLNFILQIMSEMLAQYLIYSVLVHNSSIEICACIQNLLKNTRLTCIAQYTLFCIKTLFHSHLEMKFFRILTKKKSGWSLLAEGYQLRSISGNPQVNFSVQNVAITFKWHGCLINVCVSCNSLQSTASVTLTRPPE